MKIVLLGMPGSGKGTLGGLLKERHGFEHISTGDLLREAVSSGSELGVKAKGFMDRGEYVPDDLVIDLLKKKVEKLGEDVKMLLDGYPRTVKQAKVLKDIVDLDKVVNLVVDNEIILKRLSGRRTCKSCKKGYNIHSEDLKPKEEDVCDDCSGELFVRDDDKPEVILQRFKTYDEQTKPLVDFYSAEELLHEIELTNELEDNFSKIKEALEL